MIIKVLKSFEHGILALAPKEFILSSMKLKQKSHLNIPDSLSLKTISVTGKPQLYMTLHSTIFDTCNSDLNMESIKPLGVP